MSPLQADPRVLREANISEDLLRYENGEMTSDLEVFDLFQELLDSGVLEYLQGHYQRTAAHLLEIGEIHLQESEHG